MRGRYGAFISSYISAIDCVTSSGRAADAPGGRALASRAQSRRHRSWRSASVPRGLVLQVCLQTRRCFRRRPCLSLRRVPSVTSCTIGARGCFDSRARRGARHRARMAPRVGARGWCASWRLHRACKRDCVDDAICSTHYATCGAPMISIAGIMLTTACAAELGIFTRIAALIEPRTRGPVRFAFRFVFIVAAVLQRCSRTTRRSCCSRPSSSSCCAPCTRRHPKFVMPFAFCVFVAAGVAPLPTGNPMNLVVAERAGIDFNTYALHMIPVALAGWSSPISCSRGATARRSPTKARRSAPRRRWCRYRATRSWCWRPRARASSSYPAARPVRRSDLAGRRDRRRALHADHAARGHAPRGARRWHQLGAVPVLFGVLVLATALARAGVTRELAELYAASPAPLATVGAVAAGGLGADRQSPDGAPASRSRSRAPIAGSCSPRSSAVTSALAFSDRLARGPSVESPAAPTRRRRAAADVRHRRRDRHHPVPDRLPHRALARDGRCVTRPLTTILTCVQGFDGPMGRKSRWRQRKLWLFHSPPVRSRRRRDPWRQRPRCLPPQDLRALLGVALIASPLLTAGIIKLLPEASCGFSDSPCAGR